MRRGHGKVSAHKILTLLWFSVSGGLTKNEIVSSFMEKFGLSIKETAIYQILKKLTDKEIRFVRVERAHRNNLSRNWHYRYFLTPEGLDELIRLDKTDGELKCRSLDSSPIDVPGGKRSVADFLRGPF